MIQAIESYWKWGFSVTAHTKIPTSVQFALSCLRGLDNKTFPQMSVNLIHRARICKNDHLKP